MVELVEMFVVEEMVEVMVVEVGGGGRIGGGVRVGGAGGVVGGGGVGGSG